MTPDTDTATTMIREHERRIIWLEAEVANLKTDSQRLKDELAVYQAAAISADKKMSKVLGALIGDEDMKTTGLMQRIQSIEAVTDMVKEWKWKFAGGLIVLGWAMAFGYWVLEKFFK